MTDSATGRRPSENTYVIGDAIEFLSDIRGMVTGIATSPPYNRHLGKRRIHSSDKWKSCRLVTDGYTDFGDNMPEDEYVAWQRRFLSAAMDCVGDGGVILYNTGRRIKNLHEDHRRGITDGFPLRQTVIWNRGSTHNQGGRKPSMLPPIYELIYIIAGRDWRIPEKYISETRYWGDVWHILPERKNPHPAPFPLEMAVRMAKLIDGPLADPFAGSGTMGIAATEIGVPFYLNDLSAEYRDMFHRRLDDHETTSDNDLLINLT